MLEVVRQFAEEKLAETPVEATRVRDVHCDHYAGFLHEREDLLRGPAQQDALSQIGEEIDNVRAGWAWAVEQKKSGTSSGCSIACTSSTSGGAGSRRESTPWPVPCRRSGAPPTS